MTFCGLAHPSAMSAPNSAGPTRAAEGSSFRDGLGSAPAAAAIRKDRGKVGPTSERAPALRLFLQEGHEGMHLGGPVQVHMGHAPEGREPRRVRLDHLGHISVFMPHIGRQEPDARARKHRVLHRIGIGAFVDHVFFRHLLPDPFHERRTRVQIGHAAEPVVGDVLQPVQGAVAEDVIFVRKQPHRQGSQLADDIVQVIARRTGAQRHMRLAVFQPQRAGVDDQLSAHLGVVGLVFGQRPRHQGRHLRQAGDDQLPRHRRAASMDAAR